MNILKKTKTFTLLAMILVLGQSVSINASDSETGLNTLVARAYAPIHFAVFKGDEDYCEWLEGMITCFGRKEDEKELKSLTKMLNDAKTLKSSSEEQIVEEIKSLIKQGAQVDFPDSYGRTALYWAADRNLPKVITALIALGANVEGNMGSSDSPLIMAAIDGNKDTVEALLKGGANPNCTSVEDGGTALHAAARGECWQYPSYSSEFHKTYPEELQNYKDTIILLIKYGALNTIKNVDGQTPSEVARSQQEEFYPENKDFVLEKYIKKEIRDLK